MSKLRFYKELTDAIAPCTQTSRFRSNTIVLNFDQLATHQAQAEQKPEVLEFKILKKRSSNKS